MLALAIRYLHGDMRAGDELAIRLRPLVAAVARRYAGRYLRREEVEDLTNVGLTAAVMCAPLTYDSSRGATFASWAITCAQSAIRHYARDHQNIIRMPAWRRERGDPPIIVCRNVEAKRSGEDDEECSWEDAAPVNVEREAMARLLAEHYLSLTSGATREVMRLTIAGYGSVDIARRLGCTPGRVDALLYKRQMRNRERAARRGESLSIS